VISETIDCSTFHNSEILLNYVYTCRLIRKKRDIYPESHLWETKEGSEWLRLLYFGAILFFVVHLGIGAKKLSIFFKFLRLDKRIAISPSVIKKMRLKFLSY